MTVPAPFRRALLALLALLFVGCSDSDTNLGKLNLYGDAHYDPEFRGDVESYTLLTTYERSLIGALLASQGVDTNIIKPLYDVDVYKIIYHTVDWNGQDVRASGALCVPKNVTGQVRLASYEHGTLVRDADAPSQGGYETPIGVAFASTGKLVVMPDYLGLGETFPEAPPFHPYVHAKTEATASVDIIRAGLSLAGNFNLNIKPGVILFGYSQGGHATMATHRELERYHTAEIPVFASAPLSGPYDLSGTMFDYILSEQDYSQPFFLPYVLFSYNLVYALYPSRYDFLKPEFADTLYNLLIFQPTGFDTYNNAVGNPPLRIVIDSVADAVRANPDHPIKQVLKLNDLLDWAPQAPVHIVYCQNDEQVFYQNSLLAYEAWTANGAPLVEITNNGPLDHGGCVLPALTTAKAWLDALED